jgi:outer membrane lipoprotein-sorting protein
MKKTALILLAFLSLTAVLYAQWSVKSVQKDLEKTYGDLKTISFEFSNPETKQSGSLLAVRGNKYIMKFLPVEVVCDGVTTWNYHAGDNRVLIADFEADDAQNSLELMFFSFMNNFNVSEVIRIKSSSGTSELEIVLSPKESEYDQSELTLWCDPNNYRIHMIEAEGGPLAGQWIIENLKLNKKISDKIFQYEAPEDAKVIDLRD